MNVMIYNKYKDLLTKLNIDVMKSMEGVFNVDEIIDIFSNYYYDKMILDITSIRDYQNFDNLQKLAMNINMENVIILLDNNPECGSNEYLSKLISIGIYNFTQNVEGINYLLVHPHTYMDVTKLNNINELKMVNINPTQDNNVIIKNNNNSNDNNDDIDTFNNNDNNKDYNENDKPTNMFIPNEIEENVSSNYVTNAGIKVIGFKNVTNHAGSTTLVYMLKKMLSKRKKVAAIEINKVDFLFLNDNELISTTTLDLPKEIMNKSDYDYILLDLNDYSDVSICNDVYYLIEPSTIMINKMLKKNRNILEELRKEKIILNKCVLNSSDIKTFEYETRLKVLHTIRPCDDREENIKEIEDFISSVKL